MRGRMEEFFARKMTDRANDDVCSDDYRHEAGR